MTSRQLQTEMATDPRNHDDYTVGWVCALPKEQTAATAMLDERHPDLLKPPTDQNAYTLGSIGNHNIVVACLPKGMLGNSSSATVATQMVDTFPSIKIVLMVGIGGGIPPKVKLGDVVVSTGVVQWDFGKVEDGGKLKHTGSLNNPPRSLLTALAKVETKIDMEGSRIPEFLQQMETKHPRLAAKFLCSSESLEDDLFQADHGHIQTPSTSWWTVVVAAITAILYWLLLSPIRAVSGSHDEDNHRVESQNKGAPEEGEDRCRYCDRTHIVHYGLIASGNRVIKDAAFRDQICESFGDVLCVEMEAAGLMDSFPCIVIRGICDYADSHKNKKWQEHAAAVAAAFAKELLGEVQPSDVARERRAKDQIIKQTAQDVHHS